MLTYFYRSTDPGMPALSGQNGKLLDVLDVLVNGGAAQSVTSITRSGTTATVTKAAHGFRNGARLQFAGADQAEYNVEAAITVVDANTYTYPVAGTPASPATGTITAKMAGAGWGKPFSGTNKAVYRAPAGNRFYLRVLDDGSDATNGAKVAMIRGYESMSAVDAGTGDFPTVAQMASGYFVPKSSTADATARAWWVLADGKRVLIGTGWYAAVPDAFAHAFFGDYVDAESTDPYAAGIFAATTSANALNTTPANATVRGNLAYQSIASALHAPRAASGTGTAAAQSVLVPSTSIQGSGNSALPAGLTAAGNAWADPIQVLDGTSLTTSLPRGYIPGLLYLRHYLDVATYPLYTALGDKQVIRYNGGALSAYLIDTGDWE